MSFSYTFPMFPASGSALSVNLVNLHTYAVIMSIHINMEVYVSYSQTESLKEE